MQLLVKLQSSLKALLALLSSFLPEALPTTDAQLERLCAAISALTGYPNNDSTKFAVATMILHANSNTFKATKRSFVVQLRRAAANQAASNMMHDLKNQQKAEELKRLEQQKAANEQRVQEASGQVVQEAKG